MNNPQTLIDLDNMADLKTVIARALDMGAEVAVEHHGSTAELRRWTARRIVDALKQNYRGVGLAFRRGHMDALRGAFRAGFFTASLGMPVKRTET